MAPKHNPDTSTAASLASEHNTPAILPSQNIDPSLELCKIFVKSQSPLFSRLPQEVRDIIYEKIWGDADTTRQRFPRSGYAVAYDGGNDALDFSVGTGANTTKWLLTNKQMLSEGIKQLYRKSICHLNDGSNAMSSRPDNIQLLKSLKVHSYAIHLQREPSIFDDQQRTYRINPSVRTQINRTIQWTTSSSPVKSCQIHVSRPFQEPIHARTKADFRFDLRHLELLKGHEELSRFEFHVLGDMDDDELLSKHWRVVGATHARQLEDHYYEALAAEIIRVGQFLIEGGTKRGYMKETTRESDGARQLMWGWIFEKP